VDEIGDQLLGGAFNVAAQRRTFSERTGNPHDTEPWEIIVA
jgi:hypothetical protein